MASQSNDNNVIIFGPTGAVGRAAALEAASLGAKVWLAMRDPAKSIPGIPSSPSYPRLQADLSKPESLRSAVEKSNAKTAFVYVIHESSDSMLASFTALRDAGITYVVLLSSYSVQGAPEAARNHEAHIPRLHALTEMALRESGLRYTALRPAFFNSNILWFFGAGLVNGKVRVLYPETKVDYISPADIGVVAGVLAAAPPKETAVVYLCGPEMLSQREAIGVIGKALGKELSLNEVSEEQWIEELAPMPKPLLQSVAVSMREEGVAGYPRETYEPAIQNIEKITGRKPTTLEEWTMEHKDVIEGLGQS